MARPMGRGPRRWSRGRGRSCWCTDAITVKGRPCGPGSSARSRTGAGSSSRSTATGNTLPRRSPARGAGPERRSGSRAGRPRPWPDDAPRTALHQLALGRARVPGRRSARARRTDGVPGHGALAGRGHPACRARLRLRDRVPARGSGPGRASAVRAGAHHLRGAGERAREGGQPFSLVGGYVAPGAGLHPVRAADHLRSAMNILISNDDGILARGLAVLGEVCATLGQVTVLAPDREQSGTSHSLTLHRPVRATRRPDGAFQVDGSPTDCVLLAIDMLMPAKPEFVHSGINHGQNMGEDVFYSGTVAAAMEGLVAGIPSIAVSYAGSDLDLLATHKEGLHALLRRIVDVRDFPTETLLNINLPAIPGDQVKGVKVTHLGSRVFSEEIALM